MSIIDKLKNKAGGRNKKSDKRLRSWNKAIWVLDGIALVAGLVFYHLLFAAETWALIGFGFYLFMSFYATLTTGAIVIGIILRLKRWSNYNYGFVRLLFIPVLVIVAWFTFGYITEYFAAAWEYQNLG